MMEKVAVVIPFYQIDLNEHEKISLSQCVKVLSGYPIIAATPEGFALPDIATQLGITRQQCFNPEYFVSIAGYNRLMLHGEFYQAFSSYEYILIYQLDCFVFHDALSYWCKQNWDYIGAPWIKKTYNKSWLSLKFHQWKHNRRRKMALQSGRQNEYQFENKVGNGGFSLRRVAKFLEVCHTMKNEISQYLSVQNHLFNEDVFWSIEVNRHGSRLNIPNYIIALDFAFEVSPVKASKLTKETLPFGCHDWDHYSKFWRPIFKWFGYSI